MPQAGGIIGGSEPVIQLGVADPGCRSSAFGVLVAIESDLDRIRKICADFDERRPEGLIHQITIVGLRNRNPIRSKIAGDGVRNLKCPVKKLTT